MPRSNMNPDLSTPNRGRIISGLAFDGSSHRSSNQGRFEEPADFEPGSQGNVGVNMCDGNNFADEDD